MMRTAVTVPRRQRPLLMGFSGFQAARLPSARDESHMRN